MEIAVLSREDMVAVSNIINVPCAVISINGSGEPSPSLAENPQIKGVLELYFDDTERDTDKEKAMTEEDAAKIAEFVKRMQPQIELLFVHCGAGISRSAGVAAAVAKALTKKTMPRKPFPFRGTGKGHAKIGGA